MTYRCPVVDKARSVVAGWGGKRILILGDFMLDECIYGRTERVSREAPVVIVRYDHSGYSPGGAANAAQNVSALGGKAVPLGIVGTDEAGSQLASLLRASGVTTRGLVALPGRYTTTKIRVVAGDYHAQQQQIVRIDKEQERAVSGSVEGRILRSFERELERADAVILSDYNQGIFTDRVIRESIARCRRARVPVIADSRFRLGRFVGVTTATPNEVEAAASAAVALTDDVRIETVGRRLLRRLGASSLLVTRGRFGMALFEPHRRVTFIEVVGSSEATDVTGAGDTVVSAVALAVASGADMLTAMHIANMAASIVVMKRGTAVASREELRTVMDAVEQTGRSQSP